MSSQTANEIPDRISGRVIAILLTTVLAAVTAAYFGSLRLFEAQTVSVSDSQHALYLRSLNEALKKHQHLPFVLGENPQLSENLGSGRTEELNATLEGFAEASGLEAIYLMTLSGDVVAASNHRLPSSFLGQNYGFRPYFQSAASGERSDYFAIGATTGRPGYFVAEPLMAAPGDVSGVIAIKLDVSELQASWEERGEAVLAINEDGIVVLSSNPAWLYHTIGELDPARRAAIAESRQFGSQELPRLAWVPEGDARVAVAGQSYFLTSGPTEVVNWTVHYLRAEAAVARQTWLATGVMGFFIAVLIGFSVFLRSRRIQAALVVSQRQGRELAETNARLVKAQEELERSSKLAALGQLAASVTHELGQPISALKSHLFAAEIGGEITSPETLNNLRRLADRMEATKRQLGFFARRGSEDRAPVDMALVIKEALGLMAHDLEHIEVAWTPPAAPCETMGNQLQLEQAMVNLLRNAAMAVAGIEAPRIAIDCATRADQIVVRVTDNGPGLEGVSLAKLEEPFYSTRSSGEGMGLGLAITAEIIRAHGGELTAGEVAGQGAVFEMTLAKEGT
ncbi:MAG: ATP-binding protein [Rhodobacteraceae bacterium]|nr:ATP-binding protein [Paracoccaceae bacterium]